MRRVAVLPVSLALAPCLPPEANARARPAWPAADRMVVRTGFDISKYIDDKSP